MNCLSLSVSELLLHQSMPLADGRRM